MASIIRDKNGRKRIGFTASDGTRKTLRLGRATMKQAGTVKARVEQLLLAASGATGVVDNTTIDWLAGLDDSAYDKLVAVSLVKPRTSTTLGAFVDAYIEERHDVKSGTRTVYGHIRRNLIDFFGEDKPLREIAPGDCDRWRLFLIEQGLADATVRRRTGLAKQLMRAALRRRLISSNPFEGLPSGTRGNAKRYFFVTREQTEKVLRACPDTEWRLIVALARYGGLRCPSEILALKWQDINWETSRMLVHSRKTEHHEGGESRIIPLFPELAGFLQNAYDEADECTTNVITRYQGRSNRNTNLRTQFLRIVNKAGLTPWPRLFQNLRASRETELSEQFRMALPFASTSFAWVYVFCSSARSCGRGRCMSG